ncbi:MAG TPA: amidohydrolase family protein [Candidatus Limnocylindria bacterium]|nr:amidohydrolase family protein [Candidatus Limnocylindria bacterium]
MKIDAFPHILPRRYFDRMIAVASGPASYMQKRTAAVPCLYDLEERFRVMDRFEGYVQVLTLSSPPVEALGDPALTRDLARLANDEMAELVRRYPDRFCGFAASLPMNDPEAAVREADRAIGDLDALGVQIYTNVNGLPLDDPRFEPLFARMSQLDRAIWVHPARTAMMPDYPGEDRSKYELWWVFGWPYETAIFMSRLIFAGHLDRFPNLRILTHHGGGMVPHVAGRIGPGLDQLGARTPDEDLGALARRMPRRPFDYYKMFYGDTALFGAEHALRCAIEFFGVDHMLFGSDMPFDPERGPQFIRETIANLDALGLSAADRRGIDEHNARRVLRITSPTRT